MASNGLNLSNVNNLAANVSYDYSFKIEYLDSERTGIDLTGYVLSMQIQAKNTDVDLLTLAIVGDLTSTGIYIPDPTTGEFFIQIRKADTVTVGDGQYNYQIRIIDPSSNEALFMYGNISFVEAG